MKGYDYICTVCNKVTEYIVESVPDKLPESIACSHCGETCKYDWKQSLKSGMIIPEHMKAIGHGKIRYDKMTREQKKYTKGGIDK